MPLALRTVIFLMFLFSGFCGLLYQVVWIRLAYASFGIITPVISVVISVFMLGLLIGSAAGGPIIRFLTKRFNASAILFYAVAEAIIGLGAFCVPAMYKLEQVWLLGLGSTDSTGYLALSAFAIAGALLPWCVLMGFTYPFMMAFVREHDAASASSFSYLYLANVIGAAAGTVVTAIVLIEMFGFTHTLVIAAFVNFTIAAGGFFIGKRRVPAPSGAVFRKISAEALRRGPLGALVLLFVNGFAAMSMEIIWTRNFTPVLKTVVYSYALLLATYLCATWIGSYVYRRHLSRSNVFSVRFLLGAAACFSLLPLVLTDPRLPIAGMVTVLFSICPLCGALGYLTPLLIDRYSQGAPSAAGWAYAINTLGCILGPLFASYLFLPFLGVKISLLLLSGIVALCFILNERAAALKGIRSIMTAVIVSGLMLVVYFYSDTYEETFARHSPGSLMERDYAATVIARGEGREKKLLVNGIGMTTLTPITQFMAHIPLSFCETTPASALVICFGMGTTFRSLASWGIDATAVELVPSVPRVFGFFWPDADSLMRNPRARVIIDDGRRYLMRTKKKFDVITLDPPPPVEAAGSSLLYSVEFYSLAKRRLKEGGILQQWLPSEDPTIIQAVARSLTISFPYVKVYGSIEGWGYHFIASQRPLRPITAAEAVFRMPNKARTDLRTWCAENDLETFVGKVLGREIALEAVLSPDPGVVITDAKPQNEYFLMRTFFKTGKLLPRD